MRKIGVNLYCIFLQASDQNWFRCFSFVHFIGLNRDFPFAFLFSIKFCWNLYYFHRNRWFQHHINTITSESILFFLITSMWASMYACKTNWMMWQGIYAFTLDTVAALLCCIFKFWITKRVRSFAQVSIFSFVDAPRFFFSTVFAILILYFVIVEWIKNASTF